MLQDLASSGDVDIIDDLVTHVEKSGIRFSRPRSSGSEDGDTDTSTGHSTSDCSPSSSGLGANVRSGDSQMATSEDKPKKSKEKTTDETTHTKNPGPAYATLPGGLSAWGGFFEPSSTANMSSDVQSVHSGQAHHPQAASSSNHAPGSIRDEHPNPSENASYAMSNIDAALFQDMRLPFHDDPSSVFNAPQVDVSDVMPWEDAIFGSAPVNDNNPTAFMYVLYARHTCFSSC
jgi:hypothetical protein